MICGTILAVERLLLQGTSRLQRPRVIYIQIHLTQGVNLFHQYCLKYAVCIPVAGEKEKGGDYRVK
jgi:hypothetical protein